MDDWMLNSEELDTRWSPHTIDRFAMGTTVSWKGLTHVIGVPALRQSILECVIGEKRTTGGVSPSTSSLD